MVSYNAATFYDRDRTLQGVFAAARDVTERKRVEVELQQATAMAQTASQTKSDFLASMSHEIRTPLNAIIGMADLLKETTLTSDQRVYANVFQEAGNSLLLLINDILDLSKMKPDNWTSRRWISCLARFSRIADCLHTLRRGPTPRAWPCCAGWRRRCPTCLRATPGRVRQILLNLLGNAIKFTERGEVSVEVTLEPGEAQSVVLHLRVADTGIGIPHGKQKAIFEAFDPGRRVDHPEVRRHGPGTGHLPPPGGTDGRTDLGGERRGQGIHVFFTARLRVRPERSPHGPGTPPDARRSGAQHRACETKERPGKSPSSSPMTQFTTGCCCRPTWRLLSTTSTSSKTAPRQSKKSRPGATTWCSWTCRCRSWTATRPHVPSGHGNRARAAVPSPSLQSPPMP